MIHHFQVNIARTQERILQDMPTVMGTGLLIVNYMYLLHTYNLV